MNLTANPDSRSAKANENTDSSADIKLIDGVFDAVEAMDLVTQLIHVKIKFHENKINQSSSEEDIKMRETRIKQLQRDVYEARQTLKHGRSERVRLSSTIQLSNA